MYIQNVADKQEENRSKGSPLRNRGASKAYRLTSKLRPYLHHGNVFPRDGKPQAGRSLMHHRPTVLRRATVVEGQEGVQNVC